jgi:hypothetical protein
MVKAIKTQKINISEILSPLSGKNRSNSKHTQGEKNE